MYIMMMLDIVVLLRAVSSSFASVEDSGYSDIVVLVYETTDSTKQHNYFASPVRSLVNQLGVKGIEVSVFGSSNEFEGYGSKFVSVLPVLKSMINQDTLVVITDSRDVLVNNPYDVDSYVYLLASEFRWAFYELTMHKTGAIVVSAEAQCCVSALTHVQPGGYYNPDGTRKQTACWSGKSDCQWVSDDNAAAWENAMYDAMTKHQSLLTSAASSASKNTTYVDRYLNAGLVAGKARDLIRILESAQIGPNEDDQAVLTDYMIQHPEDIVLDYGQTMFGNNRVGVQSSNEEERCIFSVVQSHGRLVHSKTSTTPLFVHSPGGYYSCHDHLATMLDIPAIPSEDRKSLQRNRDLTANYGMTASPTAAPVPLTEVSPTAAPIPLTELLTAPPTAAPVPLTELENILKSDSTSPMNMMTMSKSLLSLLRTRGN
jgi:hypothetical protein